MTMTLNEAHDFFIFFQSEGLSADTCAEIWGDSWEHYYKKWEESKCNMLYFWQRIDSDNKHKLVKYYQKECGIALPMEN